MLISQGITTKKPEISRLIRTYRIPLKNGPKIGKRRELGENGENSGENTGPYPTAVSRPSPNRLERTLHQLLLLTTIPTERCIQ